MDCSKAQPARSWYVPWRFICVVVALIYLAFFLNIGWVTKESSNYLLPSFLEENNILKDNVKKVLLGEVVQRIH